MTIRTNKNTRKVLMSGIEFELFTLDEKGHMINAADSIISRVKKDHPDIEIKRECGKNMIEIITAPHSDIALAMYKTLEDFESVVAEAKKEKVILYAYGTYPGAFTPEFHTAKRYNAQMKILGKQRFSIGGRCIGLHIHYSLPWGVFDEIHKIIKPLIRSKNTQCMVNIYNLCIAMDPALTAFAQSSPFYQSERLGKDARVIMYRGGKELDNPTGLYANLPLFGALQGYKSTNTDIINLIKERFGEWSALVKKMGYDVLTLAKHGSILDNTWNPVKINAHGTMEIRGMDMNHPDVIIAIAMAAKFIIKEVQEKFLEIIPSDIGISEPFKKEGKKIFIPPDSYVTNQLQRLSAYEGLSNETILQYCSGLLALAKQFIPQERLFFLKPLEEMLRARATVSDRIIAKAEEMGAKQDKEMTPGQAADLALALSEDLYKEIIITKQRLQEFLGK